MTPSHINWASLLHKQQEIFIHQTYAEIHVEYKKWQYFYFYLQIHTLFALSLNFYSYSSLFIDEPNHNWDFKYT